MGHGQAHILIQVEHGDLREIHIRLNQGIQGLELGRAGGDDNSSLALVINGGLDGLGNFRCGVLAQFLRGSSNVDVHNQPAFYTLY